ncbi:MAG: HAD-IIIA family hydrolase [Candidatus Micrarchaeota archaeon]|nr:HAD-IIIA family hydrolase [Candidatus Micrarchaeota archaeon]MDE1834139.1 HAD-IIIA family hydrolase [Candidatus Micrarchaeota archaeon]MDE1859534.1 HAD-IIIA family hydrolase [Candidatus Micrarchaeota archaeon]
MPAKKTPNKETLVLLDRDGVLCKDVKDGVLNISQLKLAPKLSTSLGKLNKNGIRIGIVTNQPSISRGKLKMAELRKMHRILAKKAKDSGISARNFTIKVCPHTNEDNCKCRKPKTGLIKQVVQQFRLRSRNTRFYIVGDKLTDIQTLENYYKDVLKPLKVPRSAITTILLRWGYADESEARRTLTVGNIKIVPDYEVSSFDKAVDLVLKLVRHNGLKTYLA